MENKNFFIMLGTIIALTAIIVLLLRGCKDNNAIPLEQHTIDSVQKAHEAKEAFLREQLKWSVEEAKKEKQRGDSFAVISIKRGNELEVSKAKVALLVAKGYASKHDTTAYVTNCDSILKENVYLLENVGDFQRAQEQLIGSMQKTVALKDSIISIKDSAYADVKGQLDFILPKYSKLDYTNKKINIKLTNSKILNKILGAVATAATVIAIAKK